MICSQGIKPMLGVAQETIFAEGDPCTLMRFVKTGPAEHFSPNLTKLFSSPMLAEMSDKIRSHRNNRRQVVQDVIMKATQFGSSASKKAAGLYPSSHLGAKQRESITQETVRKSLHSGQSRPSVHSRASD